MRNLKRKAGNQNVRSKWANRKMYWGHKNKILTENILTYSFPNQFLKEIMELVTY